ncbi:hypothetical protein AB1L88_03660 [Tautonia sp. JC769]|uniref:hypothetical protein n=1 Tax=Tautonia sp. JC769 TaxID=3232135 RepID=UPI003458F1A3
MSVVGVLAMVGWLAVMGAAGVALVRCLERSLATSGLGHRLDGRALLAVSWVLPEMVLGAGAMSLRLSILATAVIWGSAASNILAAGLLELVRRPDPGEEGRSPSVPNRELTAAAFLLLMAVVSVAVMIAVGREDTVVPRAIGGAVVVAVYLFGLHLMGRPPAPEKASADEGEKADELPGAGAGPGALAKWVGGAALALLVLVYAGPVAVEAGDRLIEVGIPDELPARSWGKVVGVVALVVGLILAVPDYVLGRLGPVGGSRRGSPVPDLFVASATLWAFAGVLGFSPDRMRDGVSDRMSGPMLLTVLAGSVAMVFMLASPVGVPRRARGAVLALLGVGGLALAIAAA